MAFTADQLIQSLSTAAQQKVKDANGNMVNPIGEIRNSLRDWRFNVDSNKIQALSMQDWNRMAPEFGGGFAANDRELQQQKNQLISDTLSARTPLKRAANSFGEVNGSYGFTNTSEIATAVNWANALEKYGLSSISAADQFAKYGNFSAADQVAAERAAADPAGARAAQLAQRTGGEATVIDPNTFEVKGVNSGNVYGKGTNISDALRIQTTMSTGSAPGQQVNIAETVTPSGDRKLGPGEFETLRKQLGVSESNFNQYFTRDASGNIFLKGKMGGDQPFRAESSAEMDTNTVEKATGSSFDSSFLGSLQTSGNSADAFMASISKLTDLFDQKTAEMKALDAERTKLKGDLKTGYEAANMSDDLQRLNEQYGLDTKVKQLEGLNLRIAQKMAEYQAGEAKILDQAIPTELLIGQSAALKRQQAVDVGMLTAQAAALKDNFDLSKTLADRAIELKYQDATNQINATAAFLELNKADMTSEEGKLAKKIEVILAERTRALDEQKSMASKISDLIIEVAKAGGDTSKMSLDKSLQANAAIAAPYLKSAADTKGLPASVEEYQFAKAQGYTGTYTDFVASQKTAGEPKEYQFKAASFYDRMAQGEGDLASVNEYITGLSSAQFLAQLNLPEIAQNPNFRVFMQASRNFINPVLRRESGAVIAQSEILEAQRQYWPAPGDDAQILANKARTRENLIQRMKNEAGDALNIGQPGGMSLSEFLTPGGDSEWDTLLDSVNFNKDLGTSQNGQLPKEMTKTSSSIGSGTLTGYGSSYWKPGLDYVLAGGKGAPVKMPQSFIVKSVDPASKTGGFGNRVKVQFPDGREAWFSHLDTTSVVPGKRYSAGTVVGTQGNTGNTIKVGKNGTGVHVDITMPKEGGGYYTAQEVARYLNVA
jgi:murein DD-endopeptidase MepM/ murein hydrolase activator NlpD